MQASVGPVLYSVRDYAQRVIPAGGSVGPIVWTWQRATFVTGVWVITHDGSGASAAKLALRIQDETAHDMFTDGQGRTFFAPLGPMSGGILGGGRCFPLQRPVADGDAWTLTIANGGADDVTIAALLWLFEEPIKREAA